MSNRKHAVDPSTLPDGAPVEIGYASGSVKLVYKDGDGWQYDKEAVGDGSPIDWDFDRIIAVLHRADECPPADLISTPPPLNQCLLKGEHEAHLWWYTSCGGGHMLDRYDPTEKPLRAHVCPGIEPAEPQWRQVTPEEVREGWLVERRCRGVWGSEGPSTDTLWTTEPADPDAERRRLIEAATGLSAETLEANLADKGLAIVEVSK